jgi:hypothetical protein
MNRSTETTAFALERGILSFYPPARAGWYHRFSMAKYKLAGKKAKHTAKPAAAVPCVILLIGGFALIMLFLYFVMKNSGQ